VQILLYAAGRFKLHLSNGKEINTQAKIHGGGGENVRVAKPDAI
jgi:hypothetical protein